MSGARDRILSSLRRRLNGADDPGRIAAVDGWLHEAARGPLPQVGEDGVAAFIARAEAAAAEVHRVRDDAEVVDRILTDARAGVSLVAAPHERLRRLPWPAERRPAFRNAEASDPVCITTAWAGIAETGSLVVLSGPATPTGFNFLPDRLFCLLDAELIVRHPEDIWTRLRAGGQAMPRAVNLLTGPSRTADVEQTIQLGAHGPRELIILVTWKELGGGE